jgi:hypothetical protein
LILNTSLFKKFTQSFISKNEKNIPKIPIQMYPKGPIIETIEILWRLFIKERRLILPKTKNTI